MNLSSVQFYSKLYGFMFYNLFYVKGLLTDISTFINITFIQDSLSVSKSAKRLNWTKTFSKKVDRQI